jgi:hypothetical protein
VTAVGVRRSALGARKSHRDPYRATGIRTFFRPPTADRRPPTADRRTPNAERRTPNAERPIR